VAGSRRQRPCPGCGDIFDSQLTHRKCQDCRQRAPVPGPLTATARFERQAELRRIRKTALAAAGTRPRLLDLFCGAGGAGTGYHRAGFDVTGVDISPQPRYPFRFRLADALTFPLDGFDVIHASPPCQRYARVTAWRGDPGGHPDLLRQVIARLSGTDVPWIVENVPEALPEADLELCGSQFCLDVRRHRRFALSWTVTDTLPACNWRHHDGLLPFMHEGERAYADAMGCGWMTNAEAREAIPPAYAEYIGQQLLKTDCLTAYH